MIETSASTGDRRLALIGCGAMGGAVGRHLVSSGLQVSAFDVFPATLAAAAAHGMTPAESAARAVEDAEVVLISLPTGAIVEQILFDDDDGIAQHLRPGRTVIDISTISPAESRSIAEELARLDVAYIDSPVGRTTAHAERGDLLMLAGGDDAAIDRVMWLLEVMGSTIIRCGGSGTGSTVKVANNALAQAIMVASVEAIALASASGVRAELLIEALSLTAADNAALHGSVPGRVLTGDYSLGFKLSLARKDVNLAVDLGRQFDIALPVVEAALEALSRDIGLDANQVDVAAFSRAYQLSASQAN